VQSRKSDIQAISKALDAGEISLDNARSRLRVLRIEAREAREFYTKSQTEFTARLNALGDIPVEGQTEPAEVLERRTALTQEIADVSALISQTRLNEEDAGQLLEGLSARQRATFVSETFTLEKSIFAPSQWASIAKAAPTVFKKLPAHISALQASLKAKGVWRATLLRLGGLAGFFILLVWPLRRWINSQFKTRFNRADPQDASRFMALILHISVRVIPAAIACLVIYRTCLEMGLIAPSAARLTTTIIYTSLAILLADGFAVGLFNPASPKWRLTPVQDKTARRARWLSVLTIATYGVGICLSRLTIFEPAVTASLNTSFDVGTGGLSFASAASFDNAAKIVTGLVTATLIIVASVFTPWKLIQDRASEVSETSVKWWSRLRRLGLPVALLILASLMFGYQNLACFVAERSVLLVGLFIWIWALRSGIMFLLKEFDNNILEARSNVPSPSRKAMIFWAGLAIDAGILLAVLPAAMLAIGTDAYSVRAGVVDAFTGITIGNFTISLADIVSAIIIFFVILFVTRFLQRSLDTRLFSKSGADEGFRNSFRTLLGYVGLIIAIFTAIGTIGLDLSRLAIIAGALSVGIGFGLQSIVNNFVSGLILLFERPIKVGDWVVTASGEGVVKQISVRSTEIETFDRASIIVPNSELISSSVKNWTHKNKVGRVTIPIGIAYGSDAKHVREILLKIADDNPLILSNPPPFVYFKEFGASSLDLELRAFIQDVSKGPLIRNDVRFEILDVFRQENIEIPFPQHDVHIIAPDP